MNEASLPAASARQRTAPTLDAPLGFAIGLAVPVALAVQGGGYDIVAHEATSLVVWWLIALGVAFSILPRTRPPRTVRLPLLGYALLVAWTVASLLWTSSAELTFDELARLVGYGGVALLAFMTLHRGNWRAAAGGLTIGAIAISVLSIASRLDPGAFSGTSAAVVIDGRLGYPLGYWNAVGAWGVMAFALALGWSTNRASQLGRRAAMAFVPAIGLSAYLTYSRGALIGAAVVLVALVALSADRREVMTNAAIGIAGTVAAILLARTQPEIVNGSGGAGGGMVAVCLVGLGAMSAALSDAVVRRRLGLAPWRRWSVAAVVVAAALLVIGSRALPPDHVSVTATSTPGTVQAPSVTNPASRVASLSGARSTIWRQGIDAFASKPLLGIGPGTFEFWWDSHVGRPPTRDAHSLYLQMLSELGVLGLIAVAAVVVGLLAAAIHATVQLRRFTGVSASLVAACAAFCVQAGGDWLWKIPALVALAVIAAAAAIAGSSEPRRATRLGGGGVALAGIAVLAGALMIPGIVSTQLTRDSSTLLAGGGRAKAADYARTAVSAEPWSASAHAQLALSEQAAHDLTPARADAQRAVDLEPLDWTNHLLLATIDYQDGFSKAGLGQLRAAARLDSKDPGAVKLSTLRRASRPSRIAGLGP
jgi:hypothetical protein